MRQIIKVGFLSILWSLNISIAFSSQGVIKQASQDCEKEVIELCTSQNGTCHQFCEGIHQHKKGQQKIAAIEKCKKECTPDNRCQIKPLAGADIAGNKELDAQNREQLIACIAEKRDPSGSSSGRRMTPWKEIQTPSYAKAIIKKTGE